MDVGGFGFAFEAEVTFVGPEIAAVVVAVTLELPAVAEGLWLAAVADEGPPLVAVADEGPLLADEGLSLAVSVAVVEL